MRRRAFLLRLLAACGLSLLAACQHRDGRTDASVAADELSALMVERLLLAREVALSKHYSGAPVHDPAREAAILKGLVDAGRARGLEPALVETFFTAQISASRRVQEELLADWRSGRARPGHPPLDLRADIRPRLDALTPRLLDALSRPASPTLADEAAQCLVAAGFSAEVVALATAPLRP